MVEPPNRLFVLQFQTTLLGTNISHPSRHFWVDDFPFPVLGYVSFLEGICHGLLLSTFCQKEVRENKLQKVTWLEIAKKSHRGILGALSSYPNSSTLRSERFLRLVKYICWALPKTQENQWIVKVNRGVPFIQVRRLSTHCEPGFRQVPRYPYKLSSFSNLNLITLYTLQDRLLG